MSPPPHRASVPLDHYAPGKAFSADVTVVCNVCAYRFRVAHAAAERRTRLAGENPRQFGIAAWASRPAFAPASGMGAG